MSVSPGEGMSRLSLCILVISLFLVGKTFAGDKVCPVSVKLVSSSEALSNKELSNLKKYIIKKISSSHSLNVVFSKEAEFVISVGVLDSSDIHSPSSKNAMASLSLYTATDMEMFLYSQHFGKRSKKGSLAWSESNFQRAIDFALGSYVRSCAQLTQLSLE
jgi:hypothetical protein